MTFGSNSCFRSRIEKNGPGEAVSQSLLAPPRTSSTKTTDRRWDIIIIRPMRRRRDTRLLPKSKELLLLPGVCWYLIDSASSSSNSRLLHFGTEEKDQSIYYIHTLCFLSFVVLGEEEEKRPAISRPCFHLVFFRLCSSQQFHY